MHGACVGDTCICSKGWNSPSCDSRECPDSCNGSYSLIPNSHSQKSLQYTHTQSRNTGRGECINGVCECIEGATGDACETLTCPENCNKPNGQCLNGTCVCSDMWQGATCAVKACASDCSNNGYCSNGTCICASGFRGEDCSQQACDDCQHGTCDVDSGLCVCESGWGSDDCSEFVCPGDNTCSSHGVCKKHHRTGGYCACDPGYDGSTCSIKKTKCDPPCVHGMCIEETCFCEKGYTSETCDEKLCPNDCSGVRSDLTFSHNNSHSNNTQNINQPTHKLEQTTTARNL